MRSLENTCKAVEIIAGTSIGAVNAAIIAAYKGSNNSEVDNEDSAKMLENFWLELAENIIPPLPLPQQFSSTYSTDEMRAVFASMYSAIYGNPKAFFPKWIVSTFFSTGCASIETYKRGNVNDRFKRI